MGQPAARVGDPHVCPLSDGPKPHVGGPILPPGCPTVLIGGQPAARMGDMATCVGPPDVIAQGEPTVLIGGKPAARMGDMTAHGGKIVVGFPTVLIGVPAPAPAPVASGGSKGGAAPTSAPAPVASSPNASAPPGGIAEADAIKMSKMAYEGKVGDSFTATDGTEWTIAEVREGGSGFRGAVFTDGQGNATAAFAGTDPWSMGDMWTNAAQALGFVPSQYQQADDMVSDLKGTYGDNLTVTGHSLGGGLANYAGAMNGVPGVGINSAPLGSGARDNILNNGSPQGASQFVHYNNQEFVSQSPGDQLGTVVTHENPEGVGFFSGHGIDNVDPSQPVVIAEGPLSDDVMKQRSLTSPTITRPQPII